MSLLDFDDDYFLEEDKMYVTHVLVLIDCAIGKVIKESNFS